MFTDILHSSGSSVRIYHQGAHISSFKTSEKKEVLFLSGKSLFAAGKAIRGGIPVIFPQFADAGPLPKHGFARTTMWKKERVEKEKNGSVLALFSLIESPETLQIWKHAFQLELFLELKSNSLRVELLIHNTGDNTFSFTAALHSYFRVQDFLKTTLHGLGGTSYTDRGTDLKQVQDDDELFFTGPIDRTYWRSQPELLLKEADGKSRIKITSENAPETVVWNPGKDGAAALPDMKAEEFRSMLCVEAAAIETPIVLEPGEAYGLAQVIEVG